MWAIPLLLSVAMGMVWIHALGGFAPWRNRVLTAILTVGLGTGFGLAVSSCLFFALLLTRLASPGTIVGGDLVLLALGAGVVRLRKKELPPSLGQAENSSPLTWNWILGAALVLGFGFVAWAFADTAHLLPHGDWDAWAIWNLRAKFLAGGLDGWRYAVSPLLNQSHPDYPLLLSGAIARCWMFAGGDTSGPVPLSIAALYLAAGIGVLVSSLGLTHSVTAGLAAGLVAISSKAFLTQSTAQYADVPLSFYYLATLGLLAISGTGSGSRGPWVLAGAFASFAPWTKNEGILFLLVSVLAVGLNRHGRKGIGWFALGALPVSVLAGAFKLFLAPAFEPFLKQGWSHMLGKLIDAGRCLQLLKSLGEHLLSFGDLYAHPFLLLAIAVFALRFKAKGPLAQNLWFPGLITALVGVGYAGILMVTPYDLAWQLSTAGQRLLIQLWPSLLFSVFLLLNRPEDLGVRVPDPRKGGKVRSKRR